MNRQPESPKKLDNILTAIEAFRSHDRKLSGMIYTDNWYDSHPRMLIIDPVLTPYDKVVWLVIRSRCSPSMSLAAFPTYDDIQNSLHISRGAVATSITKLRLTRWITLLRRERMRNADGQFSKDGNIYMVHGEPVSLSDTFELDANYMAFVSQCAKHRNTEVRKVASTISATFEHEVNADLDPLRDEHPFDRRLDAWNNRNGEKQASFYGYHSEALENLPKNHGTSNNRELSANRAPVVHEVNHGKNSIPVHQKNQNSSRTPANTGSSVSSRYKKITNNLTSTTSRQSDKLIFPISLTSNQRYLVKICLNRLPDDLPSPPAPWNDWQQVLLDELAGRIKIGAAGLCNPVMNPVSLISTYCKRLIEHGYGLKQDGKFQVELAEDVQQKRSKRSAAKKAYEAAKENQRRKTTQQLKSRNK